MYLEVCDGVLIEISKSFLDILRNITKMFLDNMYQGLNSKVVHSEYKLGRAMILKPAAYTSHHSLKVMRKKTRAFYMNHPIYVCVYIYIYIYIYKCIIIL
jgi:hypothetical protein